MKKLYSLLFMLLFLADFIHAQNDIFLRVYNVMGNKIWKGYFVKATDSSVFIYTHKKLKEIPVANIGFIKTKRSVVHAVLIGTLAAAVPMSVIGTVPGTQYHYYRDTAYITGSDTLLTAVTTNKDKRSITALPADVLPATFARRTTFKINGNKNSWREQRKMIEMQLVKR